MNKRRIFLAMISLIATETFATNDTIETSKFKTDFNPLKEEIETAYEKLIDDAKAVLVQAKAAAGIEDQEDIIIYEQAQEEPEPEYPREEQQQNLLEIPQEQEQQQEQAQQNQQ